MDITVPDPADPFELDRLADDGNPICPAADDPSAPPDSGDVADTPPSRP